LEHFYCDKPTLDIVQHNAADVAIAQNNLRWYDFERYSNRQHTAMKLGGLIGTISYSGNIGQYMQLIQLGEYLHVGKNTTFGLGKYMIVE